MAEAGGGGQGGRTREGHGRRRRRTLREVLRDAFSMEPFNEPLTEREVALLDRIARFIVRRGMTVPAILFLETARPLNYVGSQVMAFVEPLVRSLFTATDYVELRRILERRESIETLIQRIEHNQALRDRPPETESVGDDGAQQAPPGSEMTRQPTDELP